MAGPTILDEKEGRFINLGRMRINLLSQLARVSRGQSMLSIHSRGKVPGILLIEGITDDYFSSTIRSALLEVVTTCYPLVVMAGTAGPLRAIRNFAIDSEGIPIESLQNNLFVRGSLGRHRDRIEKRKKQGY
jgi:hypothetical protein